MTLQVLTQQATGPNRHLRGPPGTCGGRQHQTRAPDSHLLISLGLVFRHPPELQDKPMQCFVYASTRQPGNYIWLAARDEFGVVPESLARLLGELRFVLEVQLDAQRRLPLEHAEVVLEHLRGQRWHLQLPPAETLTTASQLSHAEHAAAERMQ
jgi:uncharacterized protein YcgL (UPF0745 family)